MAQSLFGQLLIRADGGASMGLGHVMRCLALAQAWQERGGRITFLTTESPSAFTARLQAEGMEWKAQPHLAGSQEDAAETAAVAGELAATCVVVDGYHLGPVFREQVKTAGAPVLVVDDLADSDLCSANLVLNQNAYATPELYREKAPGAKLLLGAKYALLRRDLLAQRGRRSDRTRERVERILVMMGGSDAPNVTLRLMRLLRLLPQPRLSLQIVVGAANPHLEALREELPNLQGQHDAVLLINPPHLAELMAKADLAISAAGSSCWEFAFFGVPLALVVTAENQQGVAAHLARAGAAEVLGHHEAFPDENALERLSTLLGNAERRAAMSDTLQEMVDGGGAGRVAEAVACYPLSLRRAEEKDARLLWEWVNDSAVRQSAFNTEPIPWEAHQGWFARRLEDADCHLWIGVDAGGTPVGQVRLEGDGEDAVLDISVSPRFRGRGFAPKLLRLAATTSFDESKWEAVQAWIKPENAASQQTFERAGFRRGAEELVRGEPAVGYRLERL